MILNLKILVANVKSNFTNKELTVIKLMCQEFSNKEIASHLNTSVRSVESARERIQQKIGSKNMIGIVVYAIKHGIMLLYEAS
ncbi:MAG: response regulator transcription factor [Flavisolibacter sp.]